MKKIMLNNSAIIFVLILLFSCSSKQFPWSNYTTLEEIINLSADKLIMIDFYADW
tara:strand:- start:2292 stop:2456 length:165 start_codon:yes stop_codon:yes gene_type:complete